MAEHNTSWRSLPWLTAALLLSLSVFCIGLFKHLSYPLLWNDEAETAMYATRILEYGYPKVHGPNNIVYEHGLQMSVAVKESHDAYIGNTWGQYYFATIGALLAERVEDFYHKTLLLRLPFALCGALGVLLFHLGVAEAFGSDRRRRLAYLALAFALSSLSISLLLHLREARSYPLVLLLVALSVRVFVARHIFLRMGEIACTVWLTLLLLLLFNTFFPAWVALVAAFGLQSAFESWREANAFQARARALARRALPLALSALLVLPVIVYFEMFYVARKMSEFMAPWGPGYGENLLSTLRFFVRYDLLAPALALRLAWLGLRWRSAAVGARDGRADVVRLSDFLWLLFVVACATGALNPVFFERYLVWLSPVLTSLLLLDAFSVVSWLPRAIPSWPAAAVRALAVAAVVACVTPALWVKREEIAGRLYEITHRYQGPLDFVIPYLLGAVREPEKLVIATNYEAPVYMYYLKSRVLLGYARADLARDMTMRPDIIVPRRGWQGVDSLKQLWEKGHYGRVRFPVANLAVNNIPALMRTRVFRHRHRFETAAPESEKGQLAIFIRQSR